MSSSQRSSMPAPGRGRMGMSPFGFPGGDDQPAAKVGQTLLRMYRYMSDRPLALFLVVALAVISAAAQAAAPIYIGHAVDGLSAFLEGDAERATASRGLTIAMVLVLVLFLVGWLTNAGSRYALAAVGQRMLLRMRNQVMQKVHELSLTYFDRNEAGDLLSRLTNDTEVITAPWGWGCRGWLPVSCCCSRSWSACCGSTGGWRWPASCCCR